MANSGKNIVICCDGTSNEPKAKSATNVFELLTFLQRDSTQIVYYDPGLGTESSPIAQTFIGRFVSKFLGLALGYGLKKNITDAYAFLMDNYQPGDKIYLFGFSRGAYTVRAIAGMIETIGLLDRGSYNLLAFATKKYMKQGKREWSDIGAFKGALSRRTQSSSPRYIVPIHFVGVWDTVKSVGLFRNSLRLSYTDALPSVQNGFHAVALEEKRSKFRPDLWSASGRTDGHVQTMWFDGSHCDVGGGHPENERGLGDISLKWMAEKAQNSGLKIDMVKLDSDCRKRRTAAGNGFEQLHNSLLPCWWIAGWWRRKLPARVWIHATTVDRKLAAGVSRYPFNLLSKMGTLDVVLNKDMLLLRAQNSVLIQKLTAEELAFITKQVIPSDGAKALSLLMQAGINCWQSELSGQIQTGDLETSAASATKAKKLLSDAATKVSKNSIKGKTGALAKVKEFLRMTSLKGAHDAITAKAPHLLESLAE